jgi:hypothetical protein
MKETSNDNDIKVARLEQTVAFLQKDIEALQGTLTRIVWSILGLTGTFFVMYGSHILKTIAVVVK